MPPIRNLQGAVAAADAFIGGYYTFRKLDSANKVNEVWRVVFDVGVLANDLITVGVDAATGEIVEFTKSGSKA